jgi:hypothetical protein
MKYPDVAGKRFISKRGTIIHIAYRHSKYYYTYWHELPPLYTGGSTARVYGKIALHHLFNNYLEVITPCVTANGGTPASA